MGFIKYRCVQVCLVFHTNDLRYVCLCLVFVKYLFQFLTEKEHEKVKMQKMSHDNNNYIQKAWCRNIRLDALERDLKCHYSYNVLQGFFKNIVL